MASRSEWLPQRLWRAVVTTFAILVALAVLGSLAGPSWNPEPMDFDLDLASTQTGIGGVKTSTPVGTYEVQTQLQEIQLTPQVRITARIQYPVGLEGKLPALLFVHGAGTADHERSFVQITHDLTSTGIITMVPDKRMDTYSTIERNYEHMARDYLVSLDVLRNLPRVDENRTGVYAVSEGSWIAPVMAASNSDISAVMLISAPVVPPRWQAGYAVDNYLRNTGVPKELFQAIPRAVGMSVPGSGMNYVDFDVSSFQQRLKQPIFVAYGTGDASMPQVQGTDIIISDAEVAGNHQVTARFYAGADHGMWVSDGVLAPGYAQDLSDWFTNLPDTAQAAPQLAGDQPVQKYRASSVPQTLWFNDLGLVIAQLITAVVSILLAFLLVPVWRFIAKRRGKTRLPAISPEIRWPLFGAVVGGLVTLVALVVYLVMVARIAMDYAHAPLRVQGGWIVVRLLAIATALMLAILLNRVVHIRAERKGVARELWAQRGLWYVRGVGGVISTTLAGLGSGILLLMLSYWGVYQLGL